MCVYIYISEVVVLAVSSKRPKISIKHLVVSNYYFVVYLDP